jgi:hypothetical protein
MKLTMTSLFLAVMAGIGCVPPQYVWWSQREEAATPPPAPAVARTAITADQVNETNAWQMEEALREELDREAQGDALPTTDRPTEKDKTTDSKQR